VIHARHATLARRLLHRAYAARLRKLHPLRVVFWEATRACNLACVHCGSTCGPRPDPDELSTAEVIAAFRDVAGAYWARDVLVAITGGEPLLRPDLLEVMSALSALGFPLGMVSNGWLLDPPAARALVECGLRTISVSVDGLEATHDQVRRRRGSFARALAALDAVAAFHPHLATEAITCVSRANLADLHGLGTLLERKRVRRWRIETVIPIGRAAGRAELTLDRVGLSRVLDFVEAERARGRNVSFGCEGWLGSRELLARDRFFLCQAGVTVGSILACGDVGACPDVNPSFTVGNVRRDRFPDLWERAFGEYRNRQWMREREPCAGCDAWRDCAGGAMHMWSRDREKLGCTYSTLCGWRP